jgi:VanZ family protein
VLKRHLPSLVLLYTIAIIIISLIPIPNLPLPEFNLLQPDKLFHFLMYFVMFLGWKKSNFFKEDKYFIKSLVIVFLVGLFTEFLQGTEYIERYYEVADLLANSIGILFSYLIFVLYPFKNKHA